MGGNISLTQRALDVKTGALTGLTLGLGWDPQRKEGVKFDLDASALGLDASGKILTEGHFVFFNNLRSPEGAIEHSGDNTTGEGAGDDETIKVNMLLLPPTLDKIVLAVSIYDATTRGQDFGLVENAYIRVLDSAGKVLTRFDLTNQAAGETAMVFGEIYRAKKPLRNTTEWKFRAIGQGYSSGLQGIATDFGVQALA